MIRPEDKQIHFIVGIGRSGTTLLTKILNKHKDLHCQPEANFLLFFLHHFKNQIGFNDSDVDLIFKQISIYTLSHPMIGWNFDLEITKQKIKTVCANNPNLNYNSLCKHIYSHFEVQEVNKSASKIIIDKNPGYTVYIDKISAFSPESKFIWLIRDYRANILSRKQSAYLKSTKIAYNAIRWKYFNVLAFNFYKKNPQKVLIVKYEDLVNNNDVIIREIYQFLNINPNEVITTDVSSIEEMKNAPTFKKFEKRFTKKYNDLDKPINTDRVNSWQTELKKDEILLCDTLCEKFATQFGYKKFTDFSMIKVILNYLKNVLTITLSIFDIKKDRLIYFLPIHYKMKRFMRRQKILGFIND